MKPHLDWHRTEIGRLLLFIGSLRLAIPVMILATAAMILGTYIDSTQGAKAAGRLVYASGWFIAIMALICMSLIAAVITRYPWQRRHVGFITVHTGLIILILGSFWSLFGRIEGQIRIREGQSANEIQMDIQRLELMRPAPGGSIVAASASAEDHVRGTIDLDGTIIEILERWANTSQEPWLADDAESPLRAFELAFDQSAANTMWIAQASKSGGPAFAGGMTVRVLGEGESWSPSEQPSEHQTGYDFTVGNQTYSLAREGQDAFPGWTITRIRRFESALVSAGGLTENPSGGENPAVDVVITNGTGTVERHTAFEKFPDMLLKRTIEGTSDSGAELRSRGSGAEELMLYGEPGALRAAYISPTGETHTFEHTDDLPWMFQPGSHIVRVLDQRTHARQTTRFVQAPLAEQFRPAIVVRINGSEPQTLAWKTSLQIPDSDKFVRYGPRRVTLPFTVQLEEFRKTDYPGTMMAMAYESDVVIDSPKHNDHRMTIYMNNPFAYDSWKVYQSGFLGDSVSIFSVMRDPGLPMTYLGCIILCIGIPVTFYSRSLSWGHPGIRRSQKRELS